MSKPASRVTPLALPPSPVTTLRSTRSFTSMTRRQVTDAGSISSALPCIRLASSMAASRLWAAPTAWMSPVKWRLMSSMGTTWDHPPPVPPPFMPNTGPMDGSRMHSMTRSPSTPRPWVSPVVVTVFPSPRGVGVIPVTTTNLP